MAYYTKVLQPGETVHRLGRLHWIVYGRAAFSLIVAIGFAVAFLILYDPDQPWMGYACAAGAVIFLLITVPVTITAAIRRATTEIVVTDRRVLFKTGLVSRHTLEMNLSKVETVDVDQPITGRMLGYGAVKVRGTGSSMEPMRGVEEPLELRNAILVG